MGDNERLTGLKFLKVFYLCSMYKFVFKYIIKKLSSSTS